MNNKPFKQNRSNKQVISFVVIFLPLSEAKLRRQQVTGGMMVAKARGGLGLGFRGAVAVEDEQYFFRRQKLGFGIRVLGFFWVALIPY